MTRNAPGVLPHHEAADPHARPASASRLLSHCPPATPSLPADPPPVLLTEEPDATSVRCRLSHCSAAADRREKGAESSMAHPATAAETAAPQA